MKTTFTRLTILLLFFVILTDVKIYGQKKDTLIAAGPQYAKPAFYQWLWGKHFRTEWTTPVKVPVIHLDTAEGGLKVHKAGGGKQTFSLRFKNAEKQEFNIRTVDKEFARTAPEMLKGTFVEDIVADLTSLMHPYGAITVPYMAEKAGVYYSKNKIVFVPHQAALDSFNQFYGNRLYLFEQRADGNTKAFSNFGNAKKVIDTEEFFEKILKDNRHRIDGEWYIKSRLFDMFLGDWDRHEDQWRWAAFKQGEMTIYRPVPKDRDMVYSKFDGVLLQTAIKAAGLFYLQSFDYNIKNITTYNYEERNLDRFLANEMTLQQWQNAAVELQQALTDTVISNAIHQLPPALFEQSGNAIIARLQARKTHLLNWATDYYYFLAKEVDVTGSKAKELFEVQRINDKETALAIYRLDDDGKMAEKPFYKRTFFSDETKEIRLYGLAGNDVYRVSGEVQNSVPVRIIGGIDKDSIADFSVVKNGRKQTFVYDNPDNIITKNKTTAVHLSSDTAINAFKYNSFKYNRTGIRPVVFYSNADRLFAGISFTSLQHAWRKEPFAAMQKLSLNYSITQKAPSVWYEGIFGQAIGNWNWVIRGSYDWVRWMNFYGLGNETKNDSTNAYYRTRLREWNILTGIQQTFLKKHTVLISGFIQGTRVLNDATNYIKHGVVNGNNNAPIYSPKSFAGAQVEYSYYHLDSDIIPSRGMAFNARVNYTKNLHEANRSFIRMDAYLKTYLPITSHWVLSVRGGAATVNGDAEFYQLPSLGGSQILRGYRRERFFGKSVVYNSNDLQWETDFKNRLLSGKIGVLALFDQGRVWMPGENSSTWHTAYGGGIMLAPFKAYMITLTYAISSETKIWQLRLNKDL